MLRLYGLAQRRRGWCGHWVVLSGVIDGGLVSGRIGAHYGGTGQAIHGVRELYE